MKKLITTAVITACLVLRAAVWPQTAMVEETPLPVPPPAVTAPEPPAAGVKLEAEIDLPAEKEKDETSQLEPSREPIKEPAPEPTPAQTAANLKLGDMVYVEGFGWLEYQ